MGLPRWLSGKEFACQVFDLWVGKIPWRRDQLPTPVFWPGEFHGRCLGSQSQTQLSGFHFIFHTLCWFPHCLSVCSVSFRINEGSLLFIVVSLFANFPSCQPLQCLFPLPLPSTPTPKWTDTRNSLHNFHQEKWSSSIPSWPLIKCFFIPLST